MTIDENAATVEMSLDVLSEALGKGADDLRAVRVVIDRARTDIASRNTSVSREVIVAATTAVNHLKHVDDALKIVLNDLKARD